MQAQDFIKDQQYSINGVPGYTYRFTTRINAGRDDQHWFFHTGGHLSHSVTQRDMDFYNIKVKTC